MSAVQHLAVTLLPDSGSSGHLNTSSSNMVDSPTSETSPSLRAPSTDPDCDRYRSSPSTGFTSAGDSDGELENSAVSSSRGKNNTAHLAATRQTQASSPPSRTWRMPFAKASAPPRASPSSSPIGGLSSSNGSPQRRRKASTMARTFRSSVGPQTAATANNDSSFVETTSEKAALALAKYWNDVQAQADAHGKGMSKVATGGNDYVVLARVENGKRIYKIRCVRATVS